MGCETCIADRNQSIVVLTRINPDNGRQLLNSLFVVSTVRNCEQSEVRLFVSDTESYAVAVMLLIPVSALAVLMLVWDGLLFDGRSAFTGVADLPINHLLSSKISTSSPKSNACLLPLSAAMPKTKVIKTRSTNESREFNDNECVVGPNECGCFLFVLLNDSLRFRVRVVPLLLSSLSSSSIAAACARVHL
jgi:hypothetical protein